MNKTNIKLFATLLISLAFLGGCKSDVEQAVSSPITQKPAVKDMSNSKQSGLEVSNSEQSKMEISKDVKVSFIFENSQVVLGEPVFLIFTVQNNLTQNIKLDLGRDRKEGFLFIVVFPDGRKVQLPQLSRGGIAIKGDLSIKPQQTYTQKVLLNQWIEFSSPGKYSLEAQLANPIKVEDGKTISTESGFNATLDVNPRDPEQLKKVSELLIQRIIESTSYEEAADAALALSYINDPVAIPYLQRALTSNQMVEPIIIKGLERIKDKSSVQVLINIINEKPNSETAALAKTALKKIESQSSDPKVKQMIKAVFLNKS